MQTEEFNHVLPNFRVKSVIYLKFNQLVLCYVINSDMMVTRVP